MKNKVEVLIFSIVVVFGLLFILTTTVELVKLPDSSTKVLAITLMIPIVGALLTGITIELLKYIFDRNEKENNRKKEKLELLTKFAISLSTNMYQHKNGIRYIDINKYSEDLNAFISIIISEVDKEAINTIKPLLQLLLSKDKTSVNDYKESIGMILVNIRKSFGYSIDIESENIIKKAII